MTALFLIAPALWLALFAFPPTVAGRHAVHNAARIVRPKGPLNPDGSVTAFAHIQEKGEFRLHKLLAIAAGLAFVLAPFAPAPLFAQVVVMAAVDSGTRRFRAFDYAGHGAEIMAAERAGVIGYRAAEIARMSDDETQAGDDVPAELARWHWLARVVFVLGRW